MHLHLPKAIPVWREFAKEVGIIVLGVVIALGGEQAVEAIHHRAEVRELRQALNDELAFDMGVQQLSVAQIPCITARLVELSRWARSLQAGRPIKLTGPMPFPATRNFRTATWRYAAGPAISLLPLRERMAYAQFYDSIETVSARKEAALAAWADLQKYQFVPEITHDDLGRIVDDIGQIGTFNNVGGPDYQSWADQFAPQLGFAPKPLHLDYTQMCKPLLAS
jgi:hypothetical protein